MITGVQVHAGNPVQFVHEIVTSHEPIHVNSERGFGAFGGDREDYSWLVYSRSGQT